MKLKCIISCVIICCTIALILQLIGLVLKYWIYEPSVKEVVGGKNITFYSLRGLWERQNQILKYKISGKEGYLDVGNKFANHKFKPGSLDSWFDAVRSLEVIGALINLGSMGTAIFWYIFANKLDYMETTSRLTFVSLIVAGILDLLGVTIMIGKVDPQLTSWGGTLCGFAGTFCIIGAAFIRYWQQEECE